MKWTLFFIFLPLMVFTQSCSETRDEAKPGNPTNNTDSWLVPVSQVFDGGPGKDGIPSVDNPKFTKADQVTFLNDQDLVLVAQEAGIIKVYPHSILDWHEIVNDDIAGKKLAITYCPLTGTGVAWNRRLKGQETTFGVSGLLYNTNLMPYDRLTNSTWSQQRLDCVNGELIETRAEVYTLVETSFGTLKKSFPHSLVLNTETGYNRSYGSYPYGDYKTNHTRLIFPVTNEDARLEKKERTLGVLMPNGEKRVYSFNSKAADPFLIQDRIGSSDIIVVGSRTHNFLIAFENRGLQLSLVINDLPAILIDEKGTRYNLLGTPLGEKDKLALSLPPQFIGYWFSWAAFYQDIDLYEE